MNDDIMVSIYCTAYNHENYIRQTLEGFLKQNTDFKYEVIVHDDASTDKTAEIIKEYEEKYPDIVRAIYQKENQYSKGVRIFEAFIAPVIKGRYVAVCEGDDFWTDAEKLKLQVEFLEQHREYSACVHQTVLFDCRTRKKRLLSPYDRDRDVDIRTIISGGGKAYHLSSLVFRREFAEHRPDFYYLGKKVGDYPLSIFLAMKGKIFFMNRTMSYYRQFSGPSSWTSEIGISEARLAETNKNLIAMLKGADEYSEYRYHKYIDSAISHFEYEMKRLNHDKEIIKNARYKRWFKRETAVNKLYILARLYVPEKIFNTVRRIMRKDNGSR
ncbi:MAG: glycosyltransferase [Clostridium sp.]|nr:glycosyltransferase [Clostridium sp.]